MGACGASKLAPTALDLGACGTSYVATPFVHPESATVLLHHTIIFSTLIRWRLSLLINDILCYVMLCYDTD